MSQILFAKGGVKVTNTAQLPEYNREKNLLLNQLVYDYLGTLDQSNYIQFNEYEDSYDSRYKQLFGENSLETWGTHKLDKVPEDETTKNLQFIWNSRNLNDPIFKGFKGVGNTGDNPKGQGQDGYPGNMEMQRTLGRGLTDESIKKYNEILASKGLELYKENHGGYRIRPIDNNIIPEILVTAPLKEKPDEISETKITIEPQSELKSTLNVEPEENKIKLNKSDILSGIRFGLIEAFNRRLNYDPKTVYTDAPELNYKVQHDLTTEGYYNDQANKYRILGKNTATSDANANFLRQLESEKLAQETTNLGKTYSSKVYNASLNQSLDADNKNRYARIENANSNKLRAAQVAEAKAAFERSKDLKTGQNLSNLLYEMQQNAKMKENLAYQNNIYKQRLLNEYNSELDKQLASEEYKSYYTELLKQFNDKKSKYIPSEHDNIPWERSIEYETAYSDMNKALSDFNTQLIKRLMQNKINTLNNTVFYKKGGSFEIEEMKEKGRNSRHYNSEINKLLKFNLSEQNKTIRGISKYAAELIKQSFK